MVKPKVFCLEGEWETSLESRMSVRPLLELLEAAGESGGPVVRNAATRAELEFHARRLTTRSVDTFPLLYLAMHGRRGALAMGDGDLRLDELPDHLGGAAERRIVYTGSCETLAVEDQVLQDFCAKSGARAVVGYSKSVAWTVSAAFDLVVLGELLHSVRLTSLFERLRRNYPGFVNGLGFTLATPNEVRRGSGRWEHT